ncbi:MAG: DNA-3-methyladenine glycosylase [Gemmatimonadetes bacterium]|nr:DNA-3-methyladenine glycosylase [Gemmatimonadota bacterium]
MTGCHTFGEPLPPEFYARPAELVARELLGAVLVSSLGGQLTAGRIVEAEAYVGPHDAASHAAQHIGRTRRNDSMFGPPGIAYIYRIYGLHWCLNTVTGDVGYPAAVLVRALEPLAGMETMRQRRSLRPDRELASGPARLAEALAISGQLDGHPLQQPPLLITTGQPLPDASISRGPRVGVTRAADWPLRFFVLGSPWVSR